MLLLSLPVYHKIFCFVNTSHHFRIKGDEVNVYKKLQTKRSAATGSAEKKSGERAEEVETGYLGEENRWTQKKRTNQWFSFS